MGADIEAIGPCNYYNHNYSYRLDEPRLQSQFNINNMKTCRLFINYYLKKDSIV